MHATAFLIVLLPILLVIPFVMLPRFRMERRARELLAKNPGAQRTSLYVAFRAGGAGKRAEFDAKIAGMASEGWTFLRACEANPLRTIRSWGGGLTMHFIRTHPSDPAAMAGL